MNERFTSKPVHIALSCSLISLYSESVTIHPNENFLVFKIAVIRVIRPVPCCDYIVLKRRELHNKEHYRA
jgi:hypothetical protein